MKKAGMKRFRKSLETKRDELLLALHQRDRIHVEAGGDDLEIMRVATERELAISHLTREWSLLRAVLAALQRIEENTFGTCESCGEEIPVRRLEAVPWAARCVPCQAAAEQGSAESGSAGSLRLHAA